MINKELIKTFSYKKGNMSLNVSVDIDKAQDIKDLVEILNEAAKDISLLSENQEK